jgi:hypothetical protein
MRISVRRELKYVAVIGRPVGCKNALIPALSRNREGVSDPLSWLRERVRVRVSVSAIAAA